MQIIALFLFSFLYFVYVTFIKATVRLCSYKHVFVFKVHTMQLVIDL